MTHQEARRQKKYERSIMLYEAALKIGTSDYLLRKAAVVNLGLAIEGTGNLTEAKRQYTSVRLRVGEQACKKKPWRGGGGVRKS